MDKKQRITLQATLWPNACKAQKWNAKDRDFRLQVIGRILGRPIKTTNEINETHDFDAVKRELLFLADNLKGTMETLAPEKGQGRRWLFLIEETRKCIAVYRDDADAYVTSVLYDGFKKMDVDDLSASVRPSRTPGGRATSELQRFFFTLNSRMNAMRKEAGHSTKQMRQLAGLEAPDPSDNDGGTVRGRDGIFYAPASADLVANLTTGGDDNIPF